MLKSELLSTEDLPLHLCNLILKQNSHPTGMGMEIGMRYVPHSISQQDVLGGWWAGNWELSSRKFQATVCCRLQKCMSLHSSLCFWAQATTCKGCKREVRFLFHLTASLEPFSLYIYAGCLERSKNHPKQMRGVIGAVGRFCTDARVVTNLKRREKNIWLTLSWVQSSSEGLIFHCVMVSAPVI